MTRERTIAWRQDLGRTLDYLDTRDDMDLERVGYVGVSFGSSAALPLLALEERLKVAVLTSGGLVSTVDTPPEANPVNYVPRITIPVLMLILAARMADTTGRLSDPLHTYVFLRRRQQLAVARYPPGPGSAQILRNMSPNRRRVRCPSASRSQ